MMSGIEAHGLNPDAVKVMKETGFDISSQQSNIIDHKILNKADYVITLCGDAKDNCLTITPHAKRQHWGGR